MDTLRRHYLDADELYRLCEIKPTMNKLELYITDVGPFRHSAGRNKLLLLVPDTRTRFGLLCML
jgi:hypothetical protein